MQRAASWRAAEQREERERERRRQDSAARVSGESEWKRAGLLRMAGGEMKGRKREGERDKGGGRERAMDWAGGSL